MDTLKHGIDIFCTATLAVVISTLTWLELRLPHITMWLSFISMVLSCLWWTHRYYSIFKKKETDVN